MAGKSKLSAREAALIAQARAELARTSAARADARPAAAVARVKRTLPAAAAEGAAAGNGDPGASANGARAASPQASAAAVPDPAERAAALMAAARAEHAQLRQRHRRRYLWAPLALLSVLSLWTLLWMWQKL